jgi:hypothetical protein
MFDTEKSLDALLEECAQREPFTPKDLFRKFVATDVDEQEKYEQENCVTASLSFFERTRLISGKKKIEFTRTLRLAKEVKYGTLTKFGRIVRRAPHFLRLGLFCVLLQWRRLAALFAALAAVKLVHNAYQGVALLMGWVEYVSFLVLVWIVYLLLRRGLG